MTESPNPVLTALADPAVLASLFPGARHEEFSAGDALFRVGDPADDVFVLRSGITKVVGRIGAGREVTIGLVGSPGAVGGLSIVDGSPRETSVYAMTAVATARIPRKGVLELALSQPAMAVGLLDIAIGWMRAAQLRLVELGSLDVSTRLARRLCELAVPDEDGTLHALPMSQAELADLVGASREAVVAALRRLRELGWIDTGRKRIAILDPDALRAHGFGAADRAQAQPTV